jgi:hypothetical protein
MLTVAIILRDRAGKNAFEARLLLPFARPELT